MSGADHDVTRRRFLKGASLAGVVSVIAPSVQRPSLRLEQPPEVAMGNGDGIGSVPARPSQLDPDNVPLNPTTTVVINNAGINFGQFIIKGTTDSSLFVLDSATNTLGVGAAPNTLQKINLKFPVTAASGTHQGINSFVEVDLPAGSSAGVFGAVLADLQVKAGNTSNVTARLTATATRVFHYGSGTLSEIRGMNMVARNWSTGSITTAYGAQYLVQNDGSGTITNAYAQYNAIAVGGAGPITTAYCFYADNPLVPGATGVLATSHGLYVAPLRGQTNYAIRIANQSLGATANYAIYSEGGANVLKAGSPTVVPLMIQGAASQTAPLQEWRNDAGNLMAVLTAGGLLDVQGVSIQLYTASVSNPPTKAQLDSVFGSPATLGAGFIGLIDRGGAQTDVYLCVSTPTSWFYTKLTKAL